jgi:hypothetical protein
MVIKWYGNERNDISIIIIIMSDMIWLLYPPNHSEQVADPNSFSHAFREENAILFELVGKHIILPSTLYYPNN